MSNQLQRSSFRIPPVVLLLGLIAPALALAGDVEVQLGGGDAFVLKDNTGAIERLHVDEATGNISRNGTLFVHTTGGFNLFMGWFAGNTGTSGGDNTGFGMSALSSVTSGDDNAAFGHIALQDLTTGADNAAFGYGALARDTTGSENAAFGSEALVDNLAGNGNSAFGFKTLRANTASYNSAFGNEALSSNTTGISNSALGSLALGSNTTGASNSAFGHASLYQNNGSSNSAFGGSALRLNTSGSYNAALGVRALRRNTTGNDNVAIGNSAGYYQTTGSDNIYIANVGVAAESGQIKIGTDGTQTEAFIAGELALGAEDAHRTLLTLRGPDDEDTGPIVFLYGDGADQVESGRIRFVEGTAETNWRGAYIVYDGSANSLQIGTHDTSSDSAADDKNALTIERSSLHVGVQRDNPSHPLHVGTDTSTGNGAHVTAGGAWTNGSSRASKEGFEALDPEAVLAKVTELPIQRWRYRDSAEGEHVGPMAEAFHAAFGLGASDAYIATVDADGVALAAIQGLQQKLERQQQTIDAQSQQIAAFLMRIEALESERPADDTGRNR